MKSVVNDRKKLRAGAEARIARDPDVPATSALLHERFARIVPDMATFANPDPARSVVRPSITVELPVVRASAHPG
jgi:hypothetical protein